MNQTTTTAYPCVFFPTNMAKTPKVVAILISVMASNCNAKFAHTVYKKRLNIIRFLSLPSTTTTIVKWLGKMRRRKSAFHFDLHETALGRMSLLVHVYAGLSFLQRMIRSCFISVFKSTRERVGGRKRFEYGYVWTR